MRKVKRARPVRRPRIRAAKEVFPGEQPTPEQRRQRPFAVEKVVEDGQVTGTPVYRRQHLFVTLARTSEKRTPEEMQALEIYRETHDRADRSFTKSCLDLDGDGLPRKPDGILHVNNVVRQARETIARVENALGPLVGTLRAVALEDRTFSDIAMERFGSRKRSWILVDVPVIKNGRPLMKDGKPVLHAVEKEEVVPRSNTHREIIRQEYRQGVRMLTAAIGDHTAGSVFEEVWIGRLESGGARIYRGVMAPKGSYRLCGRGSAVNATFENLGRGISGELEYADFDVAKAALASAAAGRLVDIDAPEVAA